MNCLMNSLKLSMFWGLWGFPIPIILELLLNQIRRTGMSVISEFQWKGGLHKLLYICPQTGNIHKYNGLILNWFGGEPTEAMDVIENLSVKLIDVCKKNKKAYNAGITTNGYNLTYEIFKKLKKLHVTEYQVTIDGLASIHNAQRVMADGAPTFDVIFGKINYYNI